MYKKKSEQGHLAKKRRSLSQTGATIIEAAIITPVFFLIILGVVDLARLSYTQTTLQYALSQTSRWGSLRQGSGGATREELIMNHIKKSAGEFGVKVEDSDIYLCAKDLLQHFTLPLEICRWEAPDNAGKPEQYVKMMVNAKFTSLIFGQVTVQAATISRNEPLFITAS